MNIVTLVGRLTAKAELKSVGEGKEAVNGQIAVNRSYKDKEGSRPTDFISFVAWGATAKVLAEHTAKGSLVGLEGELRTRSYEKDGQTHYVTEVLVNKVNLLESKAVTEGRK